MSIDPFGASDTFPAPISSSSGFWRCVFMV